MKLRIVIVDADEVSGEDVAQVLARAFQQEPALPSLAAPPRPPAALPPASPPQIAKLPAGYRPRTRKAESSDPRPVTSEKYMCDSCGADADPDQDLRKTCAKCGHKAWAKVPAKGNP